MTTYIENMDGIYLRAVSDMKLKYPDFKVIDELRRSLKVEWKSHSDILKMSEEYTGPLVSIPEAYFGLIWRFDYAAESRKRIVSKKLLQSTISPDPYYDHWVSGRYPNLHFSLRNLIPLKYKVNTEDLTVMEQLWYETRKSMRSIQTDNEDEFISTFQIFYVITHYPELDL